ncbi:MAG: hypothetical protein LUG95_04535 [Clostridiales bacterium]|nr:hypothetical protein [Clostridiales bacterium]
MLFWEFSVKTRIITIKTSSMTEKELSEEERAELRKKTIEKYIAISDAMNEAERQERLKNAKSENKKVDLYAQEIQRLAKQQGNNVVQRQSITLEELQNKNRSKGSEVQTSQQPPQSLHPNPAQPYFAQTEEQKRQKIISQAQLAETPVNTVTTKKTRAESRAGSIIGLAINIGRREYQQDAIAVSDPGATQFTPDKMFMAVLCDGMGGMNGGEKASALCIKELLESFKNTSNDINVPAFFRNSIIQIDNDVAGIEDEYGNPLGAGSTLISVIIRGTSCSGLPSGTVTFIFSEEISFTSSTRSIIILPIRLFRLKEEISL